MDTPARGSIMSEAKKVVLGLLIGLASTVACMAIVAALIALNKSAEHKESTPPQQVAQRDTAPAPKPAPAQSKPAPITPARGIQPFWTTYPNVLYIDKYDLTSNGINAYYSTDKEMLGSIIILYMSKGPKPTRPTPLSPTVITVIWPHTDNAPQHISFGKGSLYDCTPWSSDDGKDHGLSIQPKYGDLYKLISEDDITVLGDQRPIFTLDKRVKLAIKAYLEANGQLPIYEGEPQATPVVVASSARPSKLKVTYYGPRDKDTPDQTFISFDLYNVFNVPGQSLDLWLTHDHRTPQQISGDTTLSFDIRRYGPQYEYAPSDQAVIRSGDTILGAKAKCQQELKPNMGKNIRYCECFHTDITIESLKQALNSDQRIEIQIGTHPTTTLSSTSRAEIKQFIETLQSGSYPEGALEEDIDESKASGFGKPLSAGAGLTLALLEQTGGRITLEGLLPVYQVTALVRNTSSQELFLLKMTVIYRAADNSLIGTQDFFADVHHLQPGETSTIKVTTQDNLDTIDHYDLKFDANGKNVDFTVEQADRSAPRANAPTRRRRP